MHLAQRTLAALLAALTAAAPVGTTPVGTPPKATIVPSGTDLTVALTPGSATVGLVSAKISGTYNCHDLTGPHDIQITVTLHQPSSGANGTSTVGGKPCQASGEFKTTVLGAFRSGQPIRASATIHDDATMRNAEVSGLLVNSETFLSASPGFVIAGGKASLTGTALCSGGGSAPLVVSLTQLGGNGLVSGAAAVNVDCTGTQQDWLAELTPATPTSSPTPPAWLAGTPAKLLTWYADERGYSSRLIGMVQVTPTS